jgi:pyruvate,water dikinase
MKLCAWFNEISRGDVPWAGGKGANLGDMAQAGLPIPPGFVICVPAYRQAAEQSGLAARLDEIVQELDLNDADQLQQAEKDVRRLFEQIPINGQLEVLIVDYYQALGDNVPVAVRSSATAEDLAGASFAGQQETYLNVIGPGQLLKAIRKCWASLYNSQAIFYRHQKGFANIEVSMAVVVQQMIDTEKSGVIFTVDPVLRSHYQMVIEGIWGLGEGIVSGRFTPNHYKVDRETYEIITKFIPNQPEMVVKDEDGGIVTLPVPAHKVSAPVLSEAELHQLVDLGNRVHTHFGCPQDIEWGIDDQRAYLLQSRPITNL